MYMCTCTYTSMQHVARYVYNNKGTSYRTVEVEARS